MKQSLSLSDCETSSYIESDLSIIGIVCPVSEFILAGKVNKCAYMRLAKREDFSIWNRSKSVRDNLECFFWNNEKDGCQYMLFETSNDKAESMKQWSQYDFVMIIIGRDNVETARKLIAKLNKSEIITALQLLHGNSDKKDAGTSRETIVQLDIFGQETYVKANSKKTKAKSAGTSPLIGEAVMKSLLLDVEEYISTMLNSADENRKQNGKNYF